MLKGGGLWFQWQSPTDDLSSPQTTAVAPVDKKNTTSNNSVSTSSSSNNVNNNGSTTKVMNIRDEAVDVVLSTATNEDEIVERLLTQFPTYGSAASASQQGQNAPSDYYNYYWGFLHHKPSSSQPQDNVSSSGGSMGDGDHLDEDALDEVNQLQHQQRKSSKGLTAKNAASAVVEDWDLEEQNLWKTPSSLKSRHPRPSFHKSKINFLMPSIADSNHHKQTTNSGENTNSSNSNVNNNNNNKFWMPDQLCKQCYSCEVPFTVFRRRHHCRLCGQVFCNACSAFFVNSLSAQPPPPQPQPLHTPKQQQQQLPPSHSPHQQLPTQAQSSQSHPPQHHHQAATAVSSPIRVCKLCYDQVAEKGGMAVMQSTFDDGLRTTATSTSADSASGSAMGNSSSAMTTNPSTTFSSPEHRKRFRLDQQQRLFFSNAAAAAVPASAHPSIDTAATTTSIAQQQKLLLLSASSSDGGGGRGAGAVILRPSSSNTNSIGGGAGVEVVVGRIAPPNLASIDTASTANSVAGKSLSVETTNEMVIQQQKKNGIQFTGSCAADHMVLVARELLRLHAPILWSSNTLSETAKHAWINQLLSLATKCCATVDPNVKKGDLLDIRPYVKVKVIPGGSYRDCAYLSGIMFRKTVSHKNMAKEILNPRIMLLSGGIEFTRRENRIASLETLFEQEEKYMEILVAKILKHKPDILLVGRSVSRKGQELLLKAGVVLVQYVKPTLLNRISRQTGATIISSTDHVMSQFGSNVLGRCHRFRLVTFRDNEIWVDGEIVDPPSSSSPQQQGPTNNNNNKGSSNQGIKRRSIQALLADPALSNPERQAALAASKLGEGVIDGSEAMKMGLAARGVARNYIMLEGCPKHLGCTVVLRGTHQAALKQVKVVFRFLVNVAYNLKLETNYLRERSVRIRPDFVLEKKFAFSSSLCVDYGSPPAGKKVRPWNGGNDTAPRLESGEITAFDHQAILITSVWMTDKAQCCPAEVKGIVYYSIQDVALGQFLRDSCFNLSLRCQNPNCKKSVLDHSLSFVHNDGLLKITVEELDEELPPCPFDRSKDDRDALSQDEDRDESDIDRPIATWTYCNHCKKVVSPLAYISDTTWKFSFGKFLEVFFYNRDAIMNAPEQQCSCQVQSAARLYFGCGKLAARFNYEPIRPFGVFVRRCLPTEAGFQKAEALRRLELISEESARLFVKFDKHLERVSREARSLFNSPVNRPEHLQTVLSELNRIGSDVDNAAKTLHEKIASAVDSCRQQPDLELMNQALFQFPWSTRRFVFMLTSAWNERLSATGQAIAAMKKIASSSSRTDGVIGQNVSIGVGDPLNDSLMDSMKRLRKLNEQYARYNVSDITQVLPALPGTSHLQQDGDYDDEFDDPDASIDFADGVDADVLASRRRLLTRSSSQSSSTAPSRTKPTKSLGTRRQEIPRSGQDTAAVTTPPKSTGAGGAVKSAITRFFNRGGRDFDSNTVDLGIFAEGRPRLAPGVNGLVVPIWDEQLSTIIAYSLASVEYAKQFKYYSRHEVTAVPEGDIPGVTDRNSSTSSNIDKTDPQGHTDKRRAQAEQPKPTAPSSPVTAQTNSTARAAEEEIKDIERRMLVRSKSHIKHTFRDFDEKGQVTCKFVCTTYWATQFHAVRQVFLSRSGGKGESADSEPSEIEQSYVESLSSASLWDASGGKSGASFSKSSDGRFVIKCISRTELQMFLDCAPAYFEYLSKAFFHGLPTVLCKIVGVYQIGVHNRVTGKRTMEQVAVMANIFYDRKITRVFDLKGSLRGRFTSQIQTAKDEAPDTPSNTSDINNTRKKKSEWNDETMVGETEDNEERSRDQFSEDDKVPKESGSKTLLDGDFLEFTQGRPMPMTDRAKAVFQMSILNDTLFLSIINVLDYSILVGVDEENMELVVGIIDFMRQYDILKQMERVGKSLPMVVGSEAPTIIQPPLYKARFTNAMERYFMTVPCKWTAI